jgi:hypothetical protein
MSQNLTLCKAKIFGTEIQILANLGHFVDEVNLIVLMRQLSL